MYFQKFGDVTFAVALQDGKVAASTFSVDEKTAKQNILANLAFGEEFQGHAKPTATAETALQALKDIYDGKTPETKPKLATDHMTAYTQKVLAATLAIPVGYVTTYGAIAKAVGGGPRAVGNAMACNRYPIVVPCHRVVKGDMGLGGYGAGGLGVKLEFLKRERRGYTEPKTISVQGGELKVFPVEMVLSKYSS